MTLQEHYKNFSTLLLEDKLYLVKDITFDAMCKLLGTTSTDLGLLIQKELGCNGDELIEKFRSDYPDYLKLKYKNDLLNIEVLHNLS